MIRQAIKEPVGRDAFCYLRRHAPEWIPRLTRRRGKRVEHRFWQSGGGYDRNIKTPKTLLARIDSIHNNPLRRGLVKLRSGLALVQRGELWKQRGFADTAGSNSVGLGLRRRGVTANCALAGDRVGWLGHSVAVPQQSGWGTATLCPSHPRSRPAMHGTNDRNSPSPYFRIDANSPSSLDAGYHSRYSRPLFPEVFGQWYRTREEAADVRSTGLSRNPSKRTA